MTVPVSQRHCRDEVSWCGGYKVPSDSQNLLLLWITEPSIERCKTDVECFSISRILTARKDSPSSHSRTLKRDKEIGVVLFGNRDITVGKREAASEKRGERSRELNYAEVFNYLGIQLQNLLFSIWSEWSNSGQPEHFRRTMVRYSHGISSETVSGEFDGEKVRKRVEEERE